jgi:hypothetical protein
MVHEEDLVMVALRTNYPRERASETSAVLQQANDKAEIISRLPAKFVASTLVHIHALDARKHLPTTLTIRGFVIRNPLSNHCWRIVSQAFEIVSAEWCGCADDIFAETKIRGPFRSQEMRAHYILNVNPPVEIFIRL